MPSNGILKPMSRMETEQRDDEDEEFNAEEEFQKLYDKAIKLGLTGTDFKQLDAIKEIVGKQNKVQDFVKYTLIIAVSVVCVCYCLLFAYLLDWPFGREKMLHVWFSLYGVDPALEPCVVQMPEFVNDVLRPPVDCSMCEGMYSVDRVSNISIEKFEEKHAYTGVPVVIVDGAANWTAIQHFSFKFFKQMYSPGSLALENQERSCQFFPYKTSFQGLGEVMEMSEERAMMEDGSEPWYIGWSNCDFSAANILRNHYKRPYFLPRNSESSKTDWMFMGSPGYGAHMHIDNVGHPSWQAQITGTKMWTLEPPPECYFSCPERIEVTVNPGEIIVIDTNIWYHSTLNVGQDISITIGSEFD